MDRFNPKIELPWACLFLVGMAIAGWLSGGLHG